MSDTPGGLPKFPTEESNQFAETLRRIEDPPDQFVDRLYHIWPYLAIFGGLTGFWLIALIVLGLGAPESGYFGFILILPVGLVVTYFKWNAWFNYFSSRRKRERP